MSLSGTLTVGDCVDRRELWALITCVSSSLSVGEPAKEDRKTTEMSLGNVIAEIAAADPETQK